MKQKEEKEKASGGGELCVELQQSGWTVVNVKEIALELERQYGDGKVITLPNVC
jgi:hypothetical protein